MDLDKLSNIEIANQVLMHFNDYDKTYCHDPFRIIGFFDAPPPVRSSINNIEDEVLELLEKGLKYIQRTSEDGSYDLMYTLTENGREVKASGGHFVYLKIIEEKSKIDSERQRLNDEKLKYDVRNSKRIYKTYWYTFAISIVALLLSLFNLIYNLFIKK